MCGPTTSPANRYLLKLALYLACDDDASVVVGGDDHFRRLAIRHLRHLHSKRKTARRTTPPNNHANNPMRLSSGD